MTESAGNPALLNVALHAGVETKSDSAAQCASRSFVFWQRRPGWRARLMIVFGLALGPAARPAHSQTDETDSPKLTVRSVLPSATDRRIDKYTGNGWEHWIYFNASANDRGQLVVFIPGTGGKGHGAKALCALAANRGFHVVSLAYPSEVSMSVYHRSPDPDAFEKARNNVIYGKVPFEKLNTGVPNSIQNRLQQLLQYLAATYPKENWQQFLGPTGEMLFGKMILAGQSQGGGHAALLGMQHEVARVLMFGAPKDFNVRFNQPAKWYSGTSATPLNRFFSFVHSADEGHGCTFPQQLENYRAMKLSPQYSVINVDDNHAPYGHSRLLTSKRPDGNPHGCVCSNPVYREAWRYLLEEPVQ
jgi:hypothetical protein